MELPTNCIYFRGQEVIYIPDTSTEQTYETKQQAYIATIGDIDNKLLYLNLHTEEDVQRICSIYSSRVYPIATHIKVKE